MSAILIQCGLETIIKIKILHISGKQPTKNQEVDLPVSVSGVCNAGNIASLFGPHFKEVSPLGGKTSEQRRSMLRAMLMYVPLIKLRLRRLLMLSGA